MYSFPSFFGRTHRYNKFTSIAARATRQALKEEERVAAERRGVLSLNYQEWKDGKSGDRVSTLLLR